MMTMVMYNSTCEEDKWKAYADKEKNKAFNSESTNLLTMVLEMQLVALWQ